MGVYKNLFSIYCGYKKTTDTVLLFVHITRTTTTLFMCTHEMKSTGPSAVAILKYKTGQLAFTIRSIRPPVHVWKCVTFVQMLDVTLSLHNLPISKTFAFHKLQLCRYIKVDRDSVTVLRCNPLKLFPYLRTRLINGLPVTRCY